MAQARLADPIATDPTPAVAPLLWTDHLGVHFEDRPALDDVSVAFYPGQTTSLVGPNGAGKSTLLRCLDGLLEPTHGAVYLGGEQVHRPSSRIAYVPQRSEVDWTFPISVLEVVLMGRSLRRSRFRPLPAADHAAALRALETVAMQRFAHVQIGALSGGQQQRVFLARALVQDAEVYLLDEPFTGVDVPSQSLILEVLRQLCETGKTVVFATHDLAMAAESADNCLLLNRRVVASGPPREVLTAENLRATFGGAALAPLAGASRP